MLVDIIPVSWFVSNEEEECYWPKVKNEVAVVLVKNLAVPQTNWPKYSVRVLGKAGKENK